jgi:hypothetical protein
MATTTTFSNKQQRGKAEKGHLLPLASSLLSSSDPQQ